MIGVFHPHSLPQCLLWRTSCVLLVFVSCFENSLMLWLVLLLYNGCDLSSVIHLTWCVRWCLGKFFLMYRLLKELWSTSLSECLICRQLTTRIRSEDFVFLLQCVLLGRVVLQFWPPSRCYFADQAVLSFFLWQCSQYLETFHMLCWLLYLSLQGIYGTDGLTL